jgi:DNA-binding response OmpR family regulator
MSEPIQVVQDGPGALRVFVLTKQRFLAEMIKLTLNHGVYVTRDVNDTASALAIIRDWQPHLAVIDLDSGGTQLLRLAAKDGDGRVMIPILAVTRRGDLKTKLAAFDDGADDVMSMPLSPEELLARVLTLTRRSYGKYRPLKPVLKLGDLELDILNRQVRVQSSRLYLTATEQSVLYLLAANAGEVVTSDEVLETVWGTNEAHETDIVEQHIQSLSAKLHDTEREPPFITRVPGPGYRFLAPAAPVP